MKHCIEQGYCSCVTGNCIAIQFKELESQLAVRERTSQFHKSNHLAAEKQLAAVRKEYMCHVRGAKTPVMALDAIGWVLNGEDDG